MQTDIIGVTIGILGIVIGIVASYYFYRKSIRAKEPVYSVKSNNIISGSRSKYENLRVTYFKTEVENFTVSKILFFNRGSETITRKDIETSYPLRISTKDCKLLDAFILQVNKSSNNFTLLWDESGDIVYIDFDYLDKNQGGVIQLVHTGLSSEDITVSGDIMGVQALISAPSDMMEPTRDILSPRNIFGVLMFVVGTGIMIFAVRGLFTVLSPASTVSLASLGILALSILFSMVSTFRKIFPDSRKIVPKGLEKFLE